MSDLHQHCADEISELNNKIEELEAELQQATEASYQNGKTAIDRQGKIWQLEGENEALRAAIQHGRVAISAAHTAWDSDQDSRVGKILLALLGQVPGYSLDTDSFSGAALRPTP